MALEMKLKFPKHGNNNFRYQCTKFHEQANTPVSEIYETVHRHPYQLFFNFLNNYYGYTK